MGDYGNLIGLGLQAASVGSGIYSGIRANKDRDRALKQQQQLLGAVDSPESRAVNRETVEGQLAQAKQAILSSGVRGGQLAKALIDLELTRPKAIAGLNTSAATQAAGVGVPAFAQIASQAAQSQAAAGQGIGSTLALASVLASKEEKNKKRPVSNLFGAAPEEGL